MTEYYFYIHKAKPASVHRWRQTKDGLFLERWDGKSWVDSPSLYAATGIGGDNNFEEITEKEAMDFIRIHS